MNKLKIIDYMRHIATLYEEAKGYRNYTCIYCHLIYSFKT